MEIVRAGSKPSAKGPDAWFTGTVRIDPLMNPFDPARVQGGPSRSNPAPAQPGTRTRSGRR